jgi:LmbE family N-acetylglucosaminyl deacetylase
MNDCATNGAFDPHVGTAESTWASMFADATPWMPVSQGLLVVSPHPDDEVLGAGGLVHTWAERGHPVTVVSVTDGEAAYPGWRGLGQVRRHELKTALRQLAAKHISIIRLGIPDGQVSNFTNRLRNSLSSMLSREMTLIAPYEQDGHPDHDAIGRICCDLAQTHNVPLARYPIWRWHRGDPQFFRQARWGKFSLTIDARRAKAHAVQCFVSQLRPRHCAPKLPLHVLSYFERSYEAFIL